MSKSKSKKNKPYYKAKNNKSSDKVKNDKDITKNTTFMLGISLLIIMYGINYVNDFVYSRIIIIFGMCTALYGLYYSYKKNIQAKSKVNVYIDYAMGLVMVLGIIYNLYLLIRII